jgi:hypothetical protein
MFVLLDATPKKVPNGPACCSNTIISYLSKFCVLVGSSVLKALHDEAPILTKMNPKFIGPSMLLGF